MKKITIIASLMLIVGCSSKSSIDSNHSKQAMNDKYIENNLYGKMEKVNNSYIFTKISTAYNNDEPWVNLSTMRPMWNLVHEECITGVVEVTNKRITCKTEDKSLFRDKGVDVSAKRAAGYVIFSALSMGLGAALVPGKVKFNEDEFQNAVNEAKNNFLKLDNVSDSEFRKLLVEYDLEMISFKANYNQLAADYQIKAIPNFKLVDKSELYGERDINYDDHVSLRKNPIKDVNDIQSVDAGSIGSLVDLVKNRNTKSINQLKQLTSKIYIVCSNNKIEGVNYIVQCPGYIDSTQNSFDVNFIVNSIDFEKVVPRNMNFEDEKIKIEFDGYNFYVENKTESYITIDSLSFYHNSKIASSSKIGYELAPLAKSSFFSLNSLSLKKSAIDFPNMTLSEAKGKMQRLPTITRQYL
ncbi:hypothetical protein [Endozoicomonas acroporae]|uniref:hypothetical protein n=1 Tax=Endozoicomonas acroporae TaxID=1701104 RepID=UPI0013D522DF|nr:hypothetical protein [Endozoicomonas acroporae]